MSTAIHPFQGHYSPQFEIQQLHQMKSNQLGRSLSSLLEAGMRPETLNIFPSQPLHTTNPASTFKTKCKGKNKEASSSSGKDDSSIPDSKTMRRLAQNREAARKSRLRKKAYVQQLESSRMKLTQLEQELQQAKNQVRLSLYKKMSFITLNRKSSCSSLIHGDLRQQ
ncbi:bZIP transcription factor family protein [Tanacetum coccineum]